MIGATLALVTEFIALAGLSAGIRSLRVLSVIALLLVARRKFPWALPGAAMRQVGFSHRLDDRLNAVADVVRKNLGAPLVVR